MLRPATDFAYSGADVAAAARARGLRSGYGMVPAGAIHSLLKPRTDASWSKWWS
jgi:hypothetical protein